MTAQESVRDFSDEVIHNAKAMGLDALIVIGGDGTQKIGLDLAAKGLPVVGVPKTIDNDLSATDVTFGFDSAIHVATDAIDRIHTTAESHHRVMIVEVMGRDAGWIALHAGLAGGAHIILIPEIPFTVESVCAYIGQRHIFGKKYTIISLAEGVQVPEEIRKDCICSATAPSPRASASATSSAKPSPPEPRRKSASPFSATPSAAARPRPTTASSAPASASPPWTSSPSAASCKWWRCAAARSSSLISPRPSAK